MATATMNRGAGRGRDAQSPQQIPAKGWKDTLWRVKNEMEEDNLALISAAMAYYALFAFIPALTAVVLIYAWVSDPSDISNHLNMVSRFLPPEILGMLKEQLSNLAGGATRGIGFGAIFSLLIALWSASKGSKAVMKSLNIIYEETKDRGFIKQNAMALGMTLLATILSIVAIGVIVGVPTIANLIGFPEGWGMVIKITSWVLLLALFSFFLSFVYRFGPNREKAKWKWVSAGAIIASVLWALASAGFSWYATNFGDFNKTYGSFGAIIVLMMWFYISSFVILLGGEVNAELEHQTKRDSTDGEPKPMGNRGAHMADTVGAAKT